MPKAWGTRWPLHLNSFGRHSLQLIIFASAVVVLLVGDLCQGFFGRPMVGFVPTATIRIMPKLFLGQ